MGNKLKYFIITITLILIILPFILLTDLFPFLRFGMFAEPITEEVQKEKFIVSYLINNKETEFNPKEAGIGESTFYYLARNYYYRKEANKFLEKTANSVTVNASEWRLKKIVLRDDKQLKTDTTIVARLSL